MDVTPTTPQPRPTRTKSSAGKTAGPAESTGKSPSKSAKSSRRKAVAPEPQIVTEYPAELLSEAPPDLNQRIATTAYYLAEARNFEPGHELEDWLQAERQVRVD